MYLLDLAPLHEFTAIYHIIFTNMYQTTNFLYPWHTALETFNLDTPVSSLSLSPVSKASSQLSLFALTSDTIHSWH